MAAKKDVTVYIGRFNPFHLGHAHVLEAALQNSELVVVLVGSSGQARSLKNPFSFEERENMIRGWAQLQGYQNLMIMPLRDYPYNDTRWIESVQEQVKAAMTAYCIRANTILTDVYLTGSDRDESTWYLQAFPQFKLDLKPEWSREEHLKISATSVREILYGSPAATLDLLPVAKDLVAVALRGVAEGLRRDVVQSLIDGAVLKLFDAVEAHRAKPPVSHSDMVKQLRAKVPASTAAFLEQFMTTDACKLLRREWDFVRAYKAAWSVAPYPPIFVTTDAVLVQSGHVLVVTRGSFPGEGLWALPGGFLDPKERLQTCVVREVMEETGIRLAEGKRGEEITRSMLLGSVKDSYQFDHPDRSTRGRTVTTAFTMQLDDTKPLPKVRGMNMPLHETGGKAIVETTRVDWIPISEALNRTDRWFEDHHSILETMVGRMKPTR